MLNYLQLKLYYLCHTERNADNFLQSKTFFFQTIYYYTKHFKFEQLITTTKNLRYGQSLLQKTFLIL
jgi:hypothetical protein